MNRQFMGAWVAGALAALLAVPGVAGTGSAPLGPGDEAPGFTATASRAGEDFQFSFRQALAKGPVVVYFFPAAYTKGCDLEAHTFSQNADKFAAADTTIIGVSADSIARLDQFSADPDYCAGKFAVASDPDGKIAARYGLKMIPPQPGVTDVEGRAVTHGFFPRVTFVIGRDGKIIQRLSSKDDNLTPDQHVTRSLAIVQGLQKPPAP